MLDTALYLYVGYCSYMYTDVRTNLHQSSGVHLYLHQSYAIMVQFCSTEKMFEDLDEATKQQVLPLRTVNRKASEFQGFHMNWEGTRRLDDFEER